eukprot:TRINITY_DN4637_c0_g1_i1.p2 TRINITY_DN4637_c0_g1~~TRINITY_DN4637_c0_g1_i1.p2  ORF type:complete len:145 (+),score=1.02 TRINITY_DN4637_c0_g1_i1:141-575(+)
MLKFVTYSLGYQSTKALIVNQLNLIRNGRYCIVSLSLKMSLFQELFSQQEFSLFLVFFFWANHPLCWGVADIVVAWHSIYHIHCKIKPLYLLILNSLVFKLFDVLYVIQLCCSGVSVKLKQNYSRTVFMSIMQLHSVKISGAYL